MNSFSLFNHYLLKESLTENFIFSSDYFGFTTESCKFFSSNLIASLSGA